MRISDWSSDVCSSDLVEPAPEPIERIEALLEPMLRPVLRLLGRPEPVREDSAEVPIATTRRQSRDEPALAVALPDLERVVLAALLLAQRDLRFAREDELDRRVGSQDRCLVFSRMTEQVGFQ